MTRLTDRIVGRIEDKVNFILLYPDLEEAIWFYYFPGRNVWRISFNTRCNHIEVITDRIYTECNGRTLAGPGFTISINGVNDVKILGRWDGDTEEERIEASVDDEYDEEEEE